MTGRAPAARPAFRDPDDYARIRDLLRDAGYTKDGIKEALGGTDPVGAPRTELATFVHRTDDGARLSTLIRLLTLAVPVTVRRAEEALEPMSLESWVVAGLLRMEGESVHPLCRIRAMPAHWILMELPFSPGTCQPATHVMDVSPSTMMLVEATMRNPVKTALDLGTGCGYHALRAADHAARVTATDVNPRAVAFTEFNAALNGVGNIETAVGSLFEPVSDRRFELVLSNPPYVVSPETKLTFRDGNLAGDGFAQALIRGVPDHLEEGGFCQIVCEWAHVEDEPWEDRLRGWFEGLGLDAWVLRTECFDADAYASLWIGLTETREPGPAAALHGRWMDYYRERRIVAVSFGVITMRYAPGRENWFAVDESTPTRTGEWGDDVARMFAAREYLRRMPDPAALLLEPLRLLPEVRIRQELTPAKSGWQVKRMELVRSKGLCYNAGVDQWIAGLLARMNGKRPLSVLIDELAEQSGQDPSEIRPNILEVVRYLLERGFLALP
jgi:methylase of polypeptide subunit release factors